MVRYRSSEAAYRTLGVLSSARHRLLASSLRAAKFLGWRFSRENSLRREPHQLTNLFLALGSEKGIGVAKVNLRNTDALAPQRILSSEVCHDCDDHSVPH